MAPFVFLILLQTILKPQTFLLGANKLNTCMPPRQNINCGVLMNDVVLDSETKQAVSLHHCLLPPRVSGSRMSTQPTDCFYFILSFPFFKPAVPILGLLCWNRAQALQVQCSLARAGCFQGKSLSHLSLHQSTLILHQKTPSWPRALLGSDPKAQGEASWPFPAPFPFCTQTPGSLVGSSTAAFALCLLNFSFPLPLNPIKPEPTLSLHRFALPSLQVVLAQGSTLPKYTRGKSGETALILLGFTGINGN